MTKKADDKQVHKKRTRLVLRWSAAIVLCGLALALLTRNRDELDRLFRLDPQRFVLLLGVHLLYLAIYSQRFLVILRKNGLKTLKPLAWFRIFAIGRFLNKFAAQAGNVYRAVCLKREYGFSYTAYTGSFAASFWLETVFALVIGLAVILLTDPGLAMGSYPAPILLGLLLLALLAGPLCAGFLIRMFRPDSGWLQRIHQRLTQVLGSIGETVRDPGVLFKTCLLGGAAFLVAAWQIDTAFQVVGADLSFSRIIIYTIVLKLSLAVNITPGNLGLRELVYAWLGTILDVGPEVGILASAIIRAATYLLSSVLGIVLGGWPLLRKSRG